MPTIDLIEERLRDHRHIRAFHRPTVTQAVLNDAPIDRLSVHFIAGRKNWNT